MSPQGKKVARNFKLAGLCAIAVLVAEALSATDIITQVIVGLVNIKKTNNLNIKFIFIKIPVYLYFFYYFIIYLINSFVYKSELELFLHSWSCHPAWAVIRHIAIFRNKWGSLLPSLSLEWHGENDSAGHQKGESTQNNHLSVFFKKKMINFFENQKILFFLIYVFPSLFLILFLGLSVESISKSYDAWWPVIVAVFFPA